jgi:hypothetical protein
VASEPLERFLELAAQGMDDATRQAAEGLISLGGWEKQMRRIIKDTHIVSGEYALEGRDLRMFERLWHWARQQVEIRREFGWLRRFRQEIEYGLWDEESQLGRIRARAQMYANAGRRTYQQVQEREAKRSGLTEKRRVLSSAEHCPDCMAQAALGWVPIDDPRVTGVADGSTQCFTNCKCSIEYR